MVELRESDGRSEVFAIQSGREIKASLGACIHPDYADAEPETMPGLKLVHHDLHHCIAAAATPSWCRSRKTPLLYVA